MKFLEHNKIVKYKSALLIAMQDTNNQVFEGITNIEKNHSNFQANVTSEFKVMNKKISGIYGHYDNVIAMKDMKIAACTKLLQDNNIEIPENLQTTTTAAEEEEVTTTIIATIIEWELRSDL